MEKDNLGFVIVGHVDHGKSTLIGRLLYDTKSLPAEKMAEVERMSAELGRGVEFAFVMDHLQEERDQGITIDTAQTFFSTERRDYVIIDAPGHKEFIKNMITGASQAQAALLIVDVVEGVREQTRRHAYLLGMLGIEQITVVINKMDKVDWSRARFDEVSSDIITFLNMIGLMPLHIVPISASTGDNVATRSARMPCYEGPTVLEALETFAIPPGASDAPLRFPVQDVTKVGDKRMLVGRVESGVLHAGESVVFLPAGSESTVTTIEQFMKAPLAEAEAGMSIGITLAEALFIERGQVACPVNAPARVSDTIEANVFWMSRTRLAPGDRLRLKLATQEVSAEVTHIARRIDSSSLEVIAEDSDELKNNEIAEVTIRTTEPIALEQFCDVPELGRFVLVRGHDIVAGGIIPS